MLAQLPTLFSWCPVLAKPHSLSRSCKVQLHSCRRSICMSPCLWQTVPILGGGLSWGSPLRGFLLSGQAWSCCVSSPLGNPPLGCFRCAVLLPAVRAKLSTFLGKGHQLTITVPCRAKPLSPSCAWYCGQVVLQAVPKGKGEAKAWTGFPFLPLLCETRLPRKGHSKELACTIPCVNAAGLMGSGAEQCLF